MDWTHRIALITGASSGIGRATARAFAARGARVALVARTAANLDALVRELGAERAAGFALDITDAARVAALPAQVIARFGALDIVVNNAGANHRGAFVERSVAELEQIFATNLLAPALLISAALPHLKPGAMVVNVASLAGKVPVPHEAAYCASKAGLRALTRALDFELADRGVRLATVCPGPVDTGFLGDHATVPDIVFSQPMRTAEQIADAVVRAVETRAHEIDVPALSGKLATLGYLFPPLFKALRPSLERLGARTKRRLLARPRES